MISSALLSTVHCAQNLITANFGVATLRVSWIGESLYEVIVSGPGNRWFLVELGTSAGNIQTKMEYTKGIYPYTAVKLWGRYLAMLDAE